jgi:MmgE/PrpD N-terminal domain
MTDFSAARKPVRRAAVAEPVPSSDPVSSVTRELSEYVAGALGRPLPAAVAEKTRHHLLDTLAAMVAGSRLPPGRQAIAYVRAQGAAGRPRSSAAGPSPRPATPRSRTA